MSRAQPQRGVERHQESTSLLFLILAALRGFPGKIVKLIRQRELAACALSGGGRGVPVTEQRAERRKKQEGRLGIDSCGHLILVLDSLTPLVRESHFISRGRKGRNIPS